MCELPHVEKRQNIMEYRELVSTDAFVFFICLLLIKYEKYNNIHWWIIEY